MGTFKRTTIGRKPRRKKQWREDEFPEWTEPSDGSKCALGHPSNKARPDAVRLAPSVSGQTGPHGPLRPVCGQHLSNLMRSHATWETNQQLIRDREISELALASAIGLLADVTGLSLAAYVIPAAGTQMAHVVLTPDDLINVAAHFRARSAEGGKLSAYRPPLPKRTPKTPVVDPSQSLASRGHTGCVPET